MNLTVLHPWYFLLLLSLPLIWRLSARGTPVTHKVLRAVLMTSIICAMAQPVMTTRSDREYRVVILDQSDSLSSEAKAEARDYAARVGASAGPDDQLTTIQIGGAGSTDAVMLEDAQNSSSLSDALAIAAETIPEGSNGSILMISDGLSTDRNWGRAVRQLETRGIPVHSVRLGSDEMDIRPVFLEPLPVHPGEAFEVQAMIAGSGQSIEVSLLMEGQEVARSRPMDSNGRLSVTLKAEIGASDFGEFSVIVNAPTDSNRSNNRLDASYAAQPPVKLLYLTERQQGGAESMATLLGTGFEVLSQKPALIGEDFRFTDFDAVMLDDVPSGSMSTVAEANLVAAVRGEGVGLFASGGEAAFGGLESNLTELLPVRPEQKQEKADPSAALAIIIDTSGSMAGSRIETAKQLARLAVRRLQAHDRVGIVEFYGAKHWAVPMQPATNKIEIERAIGRMKAIGGTVLYPAIQEAYFGLMNANTRYKHILVLTDAGVEDDDYEGMLRQVAKDGINVSTILVGEGGHDQIMADMANWGQGRFYNVADQFGMVELVLKQPSTTKLPTYENGQFLPVARAGAGWWGDVELAQTPAMNGYVKTVARSDAETLLELAGSGDPLLTSWQYGLGRVTAFASEPVGTGTQGWNEWSDYGRWLGRVIRRTARSNGEFGVHTFRTDSGVKVYAERLVSDFDLQPEGRSIGSGQEIGFIERAPGLFVADVPMDRADDLKLEVSGHRSTVRLVNTAGSHVSAETQVAPWHALDLHALSDLTGGQYLNAVAAEQWELSSSRGEFSFIVTRLWPWFLLLGLALYLADIVYRRWPPKSSRQSGRGVGK